MPSSDLLCSIEDFYDDKTKTCHEPDYFKEGNDAGKQYSSNQLMSNYHSTEEMIRTKNSGTDMSAGIQGIQGIRDFWDSKIKTLFPDVQSDISIEILYKVQDLPKESGTNEKEALKNIIKSLDDDILVRMAPSINNVEIMRDILNVVEDKTYHVIFDNMNDTVRGQIGKRRDDVSFLGAMTDTYKFFAQYMIRRDKTGNGEYDDIVFATALADVVLKKQYKNGGFSVTFEKFKGELGAGAFDSNQMRGVEGQLSAKALGMGIGGYLDLGEDFFIHRLGLDINFDFLSFDGSFKGVVSNNEEKIGAGLGGFFVASVAELGVDLNIDTRWIRIGKPPGLEDIRDLTNKSKNPKKSIVELYFGGAGHGKQLETYYNSDKGELDIEGVIILNPGAGGVKINIDTTIKIGAIVEDLLEILKSYDSIVQQNHDLGIPMYHSSKI